MAHVISVKDENGNDQEMTGVARFPLNEWKTNKAPSISVEGWGILIVIIAQRNMKDLGAIFDIGQNIHDKEINP